MPYSTYGTAVYGERVYIICNDYIWHINTETNTSMLLSGCFSWFTLVKECSKKAEKIIRKCGCLESAETATCYSFTIRQKKIPEHLSLQIQKVVLQYSPINTNDNKGIKRREYAYHGILSGEPSVDADGVIFYFCQDDTRILTIQTPDGNSYIWLLLGN